MSHCIENILAMQLRSVNWQKLFLTLIKHELFIVVLALVVLAIQRFWFSDPELKVLDMISVVYNKSRGQRFMTTLEIPSYSFLLNRGHVVLDSHFRLFHVINEVFQLLKTELVVQIVLAKQIKQSKFHYIGSTIKKFWNEKTFK